MKLENTQVVVNDEQFRSHDLKARLVSLQIAADGAEKEVDREMARQTFQK